MICLGGATGFGGMVAVTIPSSGTTEMDKSQITITPNLDITSTGIPRVSAQVSIPAGTLTTGYTKSLAPVSLPEKIMEKRITANGTYEPDSGKLFNKVIVDVATTGAAPRVTTASATPKSDSQTITPPSGYDYLSQVTISGVPLDAQDGATITANGTITAQDGKWLKSIIVNVPNQSGGSNLSIEPAKTVNIDSAAASNTTIHINPATGYDGIASITIPTDNLYTVSGDEISNEFILQGQTGFQANASEGTHALRPFTGSMPNRAAVSAKLTSKTTTYTIPKGYHDGNGQVTLGINWTLPTFTANGLVNTYDADGNYYNAINIDLKFNDYYVGSSAPDASLGQDGDIYLKLG